MKPPLRLLEALKIMDASAERHGQRYASRPFELVFCTADPRRDIGGERITFDRAVLTQPRRCAGGRRASDQPRPMRQKRHPVNVKNVTSGEIRRVHLDLIETVNGHPVL